MPDVERPHAHQVSDQVMGPSCHPPSTRRLGGPNSLQFCSPEFRVVRVVSVDNVVVRTSRQPVMMLVHAIALRDGVSKQAISRRARRFARHQGLLVERDVRARIVRVDIVQYDELRAAELIEWILNHADELAVILGRDQNIHALSAGLARQWVRRSAPANFGAPLPSLGSAKGSKPTIWHDSPPGCAARQRSRTGQHMDGKNHDAEICAPNSPRQARP